MIWFIAIIAILGVTSASNIDLLAGEWKNELGSTMCIYQQTVQAGQLIGWYNTAVGQAKYQYDLAGRYDTGSTNGGTLGWTVTWRNKYTCEVADTTNCIRAADSTTTWSGQWQQTSSGIYIYTTWLLTSQTEPKDNWESTLVGKDTFQKIKDNCEDKEKPSDEL